MSYPYQQGGGYPQAGGYPGGGGMPQPSGGSAPYPGSAAGGMPTAYGATPATDIGFSGMSGGMPMAGQGPPQSGFGAPPQPGYGQSSYPGQQPPGPGYPGQAQPGYPGQAPPPQPAYPGQAPPSQAGYPGQPPAQAGYPGQSQPGYPGQAPQAQSGYPGQAPPSQPGYPGQSQSGYPGQAPSSQPGYPGQAPQAQSGYPGQAPQAQSGYPGQAPQAQSGYPGQAPQAQSGYPGQAPQPGHAAGAPGYGTTPGGAHPGAPPTAAFAGMAHNTQQSHAHGGGASVYPTDAMQKMNIHAQHAQRFEGTLKAHQPFDAEHDAGVLRKAMKGAGTDEKAIVDILCYRSNAQRQEIKKMFKTCYGKDLIKELKGELSKNFEKVMVGLLMTPTEFDADQLRKCIEGSGTDEAGLIEILCTRTNAEINDIKAQYKKMFKRDLEKDLMSDTSGHFRRLMVSLCNANRNETHGADMEKAKRDAQELYRAGEGKLGTDESKFNQFFCVQSYDQLQVLFSEYSKVSKKSMEKVVKSEMSGDLEDGMLAIIKVVEGRPNFFAERLYKTMKGAGTKDRQLMRILITRCEVDMVQIKQIFQQQYGKTVESWIEGDTSGDYKRSLLALAGKR